MNKAVCAIMVTYNRLDTLKIALEHVFAQTIQPDYLIIVDNNSSDGTQKYLDSIRETLDIHCLFLAANVGAGGAYTYAINYALENNLKSEYLWMIEDDTYYEKNTLAELLYNIETTPYDVISLKGFETSFGNSRTVIAKDAIQPVGSVLLDGSLIKTEIIG